MSAQDRNKFLNLPNVLTILRVALAPVFAVMVLRNRPFAALFVICLAGATDVLDGFAARKLKLKTEIGLLMDPLADKVLGATAFVLLSIRGLGATNVIPVWLTASVLGRDILIIAGGLVISLARGRQKFTPTVLGKACTVLQVMTIGWVVLANYVQASSWRLNPAVAWATSARTLSWFYAATLAFTIVSGIQYIIRGGRQMFPRRG
jgi:cardiolipin synthase (CMP-forming)